MVVRSNNKMQSKKMLEIAEIAKQLSISQKIIRRDIASGKLDSDKIGNKYQITISSFEKYKKQFKDSNELNNPKNSIVRKVNDAAIDWTDIFKYWNKLKKSSLTFVDLFSGAGGITKGFELAGLKGICGLV